MGVCICDAAAGQALQFVFIPNLHRVVYTEAKVDVTQEIEQRAQQAAQVGVDYCALFSISCVTSTLASV